MVRLFLLFLFLFVANDFFAQTVVDSISGSPVSYVEVYSDYGKIVGITNKKGEIPTHFFKENNSDNYIIFKYGYKEKKVSLDEIKKNETIKLSPYAFELDEVVLENKKSEAKYIELTAYFRSIQYSDSLPQYFMDGIVKYVYDVEKNKIEAKITENRSYHDQSVKNLKKGIAFCIVGIPNIEDFFKLNTLKDVFDESHNILYQNNVKVGELTDSGRKVEIQIYSETNPKVMKGLGMVSTLKNYIITSDYDNNDFLTRIKEIRNYQIIKKKQNLVTQFDTSHELYILSINSINEFPKDLNSKPYYQFKRSSEFKNNYWEDKTINMVVPPLPEPVQNFINNHFYRL